MCLELKDIHKRCWSGGATDITGTGHQRYHPSAVRISLHATPTPGNEMMNAMISLE